MKWVEVHRAEGLPVLQNRMFRTREEALACPRGDIILVRDLESGLIFNRAFVPESIQYDADYQNEQAVSSMFRDHLNEVTSIISRHFQGSSLIEVGCGKGFFLEHLSRHGFDIKGLDPAYEGQNPNIIKSHFSPEIGLTAGGIVLRHVLEHVLHPIAFLENLRNSNGGTGKIYIEVPCFDWICQRRAWFDVFYEHVNYFRLDDFQRIFGKIEECGHVFGGQYLYVVADLESLRRPLVSASDDFNFPADFLEGVAKQARQVKQANEKGPTVIWGGASKGVIFSLFMERAGSPVDFVIDINPAKQGKYLAATGLRVSSADEVLQIIEPGSNIFVMNGNYVDEIRQLTGDKFNYITVDHENI